MAYYKQEQCPTSYATCSIGYKDGRVHNLPSKLAAISAAHFDAIELSMPDVLAYGAELKGHEIDPRDYDSLVEIGGAIKKLTTQNGLKILMLQPFANFEGWPKGSGERKDAFKRAEGWMRVMEAVGTDMLQIGSSDAIGISSNIDDLASDLAELADMMKPKGFRIAYENWCWATHAPDWKDVWRIVQKADRSNIGLCLDTFQSAGGEWASPCTQNGRKEKRLSDGNSTATQETTTIEAADEEETDKSWIQSLKTLTKTVPADKIYLLQISDAYLMQPPLENKSDKDGLRPRGQWSHDFRPLPFDTNEDANRGGRKASYLPVTAFTHAVLQTGFRGWLSIEVFDGQASKKYGDDMDPYAVKAMESLKTLLREAEGKDKMEGRE